MPSPLATVAAPWWSDPTTLTAISAWATIAALAVAVITLIRAERHIAKSRDESTRQLTEAKREATAERVTLFQLEVLRDLAATLDERLGLIELRNHLFARVSALPAGTLPTWEKLRDENLPALIDVARSVNPTLPAEAPTVRLSLQGPVALALWTALRAELVAAIETRVARE